MELHTESALDRDEPGELAVSQVIDRLRRVGAAPAERDPLLRDRAGDELLDEFWRRRSGDGRH